MDNFFIQKTCDRCHKELTGGRIMSWFTEECICMECSQKEKEIRKKLKNNGMEYEGCGYIPEV